ncbi:MAG: hypothetical protein LKI94_04610 [Sporolactobacillus sp.]|jgi:hypothetical protein|nr:hypothetical protein [Sporolactobacillus sp.]
MYKAFMFNGVLANEIEAKIQRNFAGKDVELPIRELPNKGTPENPIVLHGTTKQRVEQVRKSLGYDKNWQPKADK